MPTRSIVLLLALLLCVLTGTGCVEKEKHFSKASKELQKTIVMTAAPKPRHPLDVRFGDKINLLGYDLSDETVSEGEPFTVTWYWSVIGPLEPGYKIFTHLANDKKQSVVNLDAARPFREAYPEAQWKAGDRLRDVQEITIPPGWGSKSATFFLGFWKDEQRLPVTGVKSSENRAEVLTIAIGPGNGPSVDPATLPRLIARRATAALRIDGKLDEADWTAAQPTPDFVNTMSGASAAFRATVRVVYDERNLYLGYTVADDFLRSSFEKDDDHLWEQDVVELMVDPNGDGKSYFEAQVAPTGRVFDTRYDSRRLPRPFGDMAWSSNMRAAVVVRGKVSDDQADEGYDVELSIPWTAFAVGPDPASPPQAAETWRMNFYVMDAREKGQRAAGWSAPLIGDFHTLTRFGRVFFPQAASSDGKSATAAPLVPTGPVPVLIAPDVKK